MTSTTYSETEALATGEAHGSAGYRGGFVNVLVGVDGTTTGRDAIALADRLRGAKGRLTLAHVLPEDRRIPSGGARDDAPAWRRARETLAREREAADVSARLVGLQSSSVGQSLRRLAEERAADLLVVGSCSRGLVGRVLVGDDARDTVSGAACPVAVAPHGYAAARARPIETIGVAYDAGPEAEVALAVARSLARSRSAQVRALTVVSPGLAGAGPWGEVDATTPIAIDAIQQAASDRLRSLDGVQGRVVVGTAGAELVAFGDEVDLLVVGSRGHGPLRRLMLGSSSLHLTREARCPLLVVPRPAGAAAQVRRDSASRRIA